jgi:hypothetical protein
MKRPLCVYVSAPAFRPRGAAQLLPAVQRAAAALAAALQAARGGGGERSAGARARARMPATKAAEQGCVCIHTLATPPRRRAP